MRMIAAILDCPFHLSIMSEAPVQPRSTAALEQAAIARTDAVEKRVQEEAPVIATETASDERDMTIGELYEIHEELSELEANAKAGESVEEIKKELEKPKKSLFHTGGIFLRRKQRDADAADPDEESRKTDAVREDVAGENVIQTEYEEQKEPEEVPAAEEKDDFEPVVSHDDAEEDREVGEVNPYTGREYQSNSVRMHPTRIGYVQVYDRTIHKWTDMTEWAFLGLQERKKALLGKAYEPPIYLD